MDPDLGPGQDLEVSKRNFESVLAESRALREQFLMLRSEIGALVTSVQVTVNQIQRTSGLHNQQVGVPAAVHVLTPREYEVLKLIVSSHTTKEIADRLRIAFRTAVNHRTHIMSKLGIHDVAGLTRFAIESGLLGSDSPPVAATAQKHG